MADVCVAQQHTRSNGRLMECTGSSARDGAPRRRSACLLITLASLPACGGDVWVPRIDGFAPERGTIGTEIVIQGAYFDRDGRGYSLHGAAVPWRVYLDGPDRRLEL